MFANTKSDLGSNPDILACMEAFMKEYEGVGLAVAQIDQGEVRFKNWV